MVVQATFHEMNKITPRSERRSALRKDLTEPTLLEMSGYRVNQAPPLAISRNVELARVGPQYPFCLLRRFRLVRDFRFSPMDVDECFFAQPLTQIKGTRRATRRARFACSAASATSFTSLYAPGASSATPRKDRLRIRIPCRPNS